MGAYRIINACEVVSVLSVWSQLRCSRLGNISARTEVLPWLLEPTIAQEKSTEQARCIRGDLAIELTENLVHGSDGPESAAREIALFFPDTA